MKSEFEVSLGSLKCEARMLKWEVGKSGSRGVGESGSRGVGESGSRGVGESGSRGVGESGSRGVGESEVESPSSAFVVYNSSVM